MAFKYAKNRIVVGDINTGPYRAALARFREAGWDVAAFANCKDLIADIIANPPRLLITNLMLYNGSGMKVLDVARETPQLKETQVLVVSSFASKENINECSRRGAKDFILTPFPPENLYRRLIYHLQDKREIRDKEITDVSGKKITTRPSTDLEHAMAVLMESLNVVTVGTDPYQVLFFLTTKMKEIASVNRCSCIISDPGGTQGIVVASNDDPKITSLALDMSKYPEVSHVMNTGLVVIVDDITKNPLTQSIRHQVKTIRIAHLMVLPIRLHGECIGVFSLRSDESSNPFTLEVARICQAVCNTASPVVKALRDILVGGTIHGPGRKVS